MLLELDKKTANALDSSNGQLTEIRFQVECVLVKLKLNTKARWQNGYAADCKSVDLGSTPGRASTQCPGGEIGRHKGFKIPRGFPRAGSSPALGTILEKATFGWLFCAYSHRSKKLLG